LNEVRLQLEQVLWTSVTLNVLWVAILGLVAAVLAAVVVWSVTRLRAIELRCTALEEDLERLRARQTGPIKTLDRVRALLTDGESVWRRDEGKLRSLGLSAGSQEAS
jgi:hypothetical protein